MPSQSSLIGAAGEHFVLYCLLRQGYIAALAPQGAPSVDIVVSNVLCQRLCTIQVKSRRPKGGWVLNTKHEKPMESLFFCFVDLPDDVVSAPTVYVIPSEIVAKVTSYVHSTWLKQLGKQGQQHQDNNVRQLLPDYTNILKDKVDIYTSGWLEKYRNRWDLLGLD